MKSNYEEKRERQIENAERLAEKNEQLSKSLAESANRMASVIPMGQPILVGHHSEKRDRNYREKIHNTFGKSVEADRKAQYYKEKAERLLNNTAISSDDPNAVDKLQEKLEGMQATQELYKAINKIVKKKISDAEKVTALMELGLLEATAVKLLAPDFCGRVGIPSYKLTNNNGNMARVKQRLEQLKKIESMESSEEMFGDIKLVVSVDDNRVQIFFPDIPAKEIREEMKHNGFRWAPSVGAWQRNISNHAIYLAKEILKKL